MATRTPRARESSKARRKRKTEEERMKETKNDNRPKLETDELIFDYLLRQWQNIAEIREFEHMNTSKPYMYILNWKKDSNELETERKRTEKAFFDGMTQNW